MQAARGSIVLGFAVCVVVSGCSAPQGADTAPARTDAVDSYDLARLADVEPDLPPGFTASPFGVAELNPAYVDSIGDVLSYGRPLTVVPAQCRALLKPVDGQVGAEINGSRAAGPAKQSIVLNATVPVTVPNVAPKFGCDRISFDVEDDSVPTRGTAERITAPSIAGATTEALKILFDGYPEIEYHYSAVIDERLYVDVAARLAPDSDVERLISGLLVESVAAVRGR